MKPVLALVSAVGLSLIACGPNVSGSDDDDDDTTDVDGGGLDPNCTPTLEACTGGEDEDCDGLTDCDDSDCDGIDGCAACGEIDHPEATLALPDGDGAEYTSSITFANFGANQMLTDIADFRGICVNMEHSWVRDLEIKMRCPNGTEVILHNFGGRTGGEVFVGTPDDNDGVDPTPGTGAEYCWTPTATNPTWLEYANNGLIHDIPAGDYRAFGNMSDLLGCPLNGPWSLTVTDDWPIDNGFIFSWGLRFDPSLVEDCSEWPPIG